MSRRFGVHPWMALLLLLGACSYCPTEPDGTADLGDRLIWSAPLPDRANGEVAVSDDMVFVATDTGLVGLDRASGARRWFVAVTGLGSSKRLLVRGGRVLTAGGYAVRAHDAATGAVLWERPFPYAAAPALSVISADGTTMYVGLRDGRVLALAQSDGHSVWERHVDTPEWKYAALLGGTTISGDTLFVTGTRYLTANGYQESAVVVALDRATGRELWRYESTGGFSNIPSAVVLAGKGLVYLDGYTGRVVGLSGTTGVERWSQPVKGFFFGGPATRGDTIFAVTSESRAYALDAATGAVFWTGTLDAGATSAGVCGHELFVGDFEVEVHAASDGSRLGVGFPASADEVVTSYVFATDGVAYVGTTDRMLAFRCH